MRIQRHSLNLLNVARPGWSARPPEKGGGSSLPIHYEEEEKREKSTIERKREEAALDLGDAERRIRRRKPFFHCAVFSYLSYIANIYTYYPPKRTFYFAYRLRNQTYDVIRAD